MPVHHPDFAGDQAYGPAVRCGRRNGRVAGDGTGDVLDIDGLTEVLRKVFSCQACALVAAAVLDIRDDELDGRSGVGHGDRRQCVGWLVGQPERWQVA